MFPFRSICYSVTSHVFGKPRRSDIKIVQAVKEMLLFNGR